MMVARREEMRRMGAVDQAYRKVGHWGTQGSQGLVCMGHPGPGPCVYGAPRAVLHELLCQRVDHHPVHPACVCSGPGLSLPACVLHQEMDCALVEYERGLLPSALQDAVISREEEAASKNG